MKKLLILSALVVVAVCMFLYIKNNPVKQPERVEGTFANAERKMIV